MQHYIESSKIIPICEEFLVEVESIITQEEVRSLQNKRQEVWRRETIGNHRYREPSDFNWLARFLGEFKSCKEKAKLMKDKAVLVQGLFLDDSDFAFLAKLNSKDKIEELKSLFQDAKVEVELIYEDHLVNVQKDLEKQKEAQTLGVVVDLSKAPQGKTPERYKEKTFWEEIKSIWKD